MNLAKNSISLAKGQTISLAKATADAGFHGELRKVIVGLGWDPVKRGLFSAKKDIDCDAFAIVCSSNDKIRSNKDVIYFGNLNKGGAVAHQGDNLTGDGDGDDEQIIINLPNVDNDKVLIGVNIYEGRRRNQDFSDLENAFVRLVNNDTGEEICKFVLNENYKGYVTMLFGELYKYHGEWKFRALGNPVDAPSIKELVNKFI